MCQILSSSSEDKIKDLEDRYRRLMVKFDRGVQYETLLSVKDVNRGVKMLGEYSCFRLEVPHSTNIFSVQVDFAGDQILSKQLDPQDSTPLLRTDLAARDKLLQGMCSWANDFRTNAPNVLWAHGYPGVGKSSIAAQLFDCLSRSHRTVAFATFEKGATLCQIWRTISHSLAFGDPICRERILEVTSHNPTAWMSSNRNPDTDFDLLVYSPLLALRDQLASARPGRRPVIIIDALDHFDSHDYTFGFPALHRHIAGWAKGWSRPNERQSRPVQPQDQPTELPKLGSYVKLIVLSRHESHVRRIFSELGPQWRPLSDPPRLDGDGNPSIEDFVNPFLHSILHIPAGIFVAPEAAGAISQYLHPALQRICDLHPKPDQTVIDNLTEHAAGMFRFAKAVADYTAGVDEDGAATVGPLHITPYHRLNSFGTDHRLPYNGLHSRYHDLLRKLCPHDYWEKVLPVLCDLASNRFVVDGDTPGDAAVLARKIVEKLSSVLAYSNDNSPQFVHPSFCHFLCQQFIEPHDSKIERCPASRFPLLIGDEH
jgi:hypothetical protein